MKNKDGTWSQMLPDGTWRHAATYEEAVKGIPSSLNKEDPFGLSWEEEQDHLGNL